MGGGRECGGGRSLPSANPDNVAAGGATDARHEGGGKGGEIRPCTRCSLIYLVLHYVSLPHISILLWGSPSIQKRLDGSRTINISYIYVYFGDSVHIVMRQPFKLLD
jgi:hypothetical protein